MNNKTDNFIFNTKKLQEAEDILKKYPAERKRSALLPLLNLAQEQNDGWLSTSCIEYIAKFLNLHYMQVFEVATFYTMFNLKPVGKYHIQICTTTPCWLRGSDDIKNACETKLGIKCNHITPDNQFSLIEVECLGACVNAPLVQINNDYYENLNAELMKELIDKLAVNK